MDGWAWLALTGLGVFHGINPAMGWLFAVALGLHRQRLSSVALAIVPLALGHAAAVATALAALALAGVWLRAPLVQALAGATLITWGIYHAARGHRHRLRVGMTTGLAGLALWSFLVASAHGAGLMLVPVLLEGVPGHHEGDADLHWHGFSGASGARLMLGAIAVHTFAMAATTAAVALAVYRWVGLAILRRAWFNLDRLWAAALIGAGLLLMLAYLRHWLAATGHGG